MIDDVRTALTKNLNDLMKVKGIKSVELAEKVGVSKSAVSHWLAGDNSPNIEILAKICQVYDVKLSEMLNEKIEVTYFDKELLRKYNILDQFGKKAVDALIDVEYARCTVQAEQDLIDIPFYELTAASAGYGEYDMNNEYPTVKRVPRTSVTENASYCCYVRGQSMQPMFNDGDLVFVNSKEDAEIGDIGIFAYNGDIYIKQRGEDELISLNKEFPNIKKSPDIICQGKVLGKI